MVFDVPPLLHVDPREIRYLLLDYCRNRQSMHHALVDTGAPLLKAIASLSGRRYAGNDPPPPGVYKSFAASDRQNKLVVTVRLASSASMETAFSEVVLPSLATLCCTANIKIQLLGWFAGAWAGSSTSSTA